MDNVTIAPFFFCFGKIQIKQIHIIEFQQNMIFKFFWTKTQVKFFSNKFSLPKIKKYRQFFLDLIEIILC